MVIWWNFQVQGRCTGVKFLSQQQYSGFKQLIISINLSVLKLHFPDFLGLDNSRFSKKNPYFASNLFGYDYSHLPPTC